MPRRTKMTDPNDPMVILARVALEEQAEKVKERENKKRSQEQALKQHEQTERAREMSDFRRAELCDHLLGNHGPRVIPDIRRSALNMHQLSSAQTYIRCQKCRFEWRPCDTDKLWHRWEGGEGTADRKLVAYPNPTKKGWNKIRDFYFSFANAKDLTSRAFRLEPSREEMVEEEVEVPTV